MKSPFFFENHHLPYLSTQYYWISIAYFSGSSLVILSHSGRVGFWNAFSQHWQVQDVQPIGAFDFTGSLLFLGCNNGQISYIGEIFFSSSFTNTNFIKTVNLCVLVKLSVSKIIFFNKKSKDMEKFPLRLKDDSLLVNNFFKDPRSETITALSVYLTSLSNGKNKFLVKLSLFLEFILTKKIPGFCNSFLFYIIIIIWYLNCLPKSFFFYSCTK